MPLEDFGDVTRLPEHQRQLHRAQMLAERRRRALEQTAVSDEERRWPGLVEVEQSPIQTEEQ